MKLILKIWVISLSILLGINTSCTDELIIEDPENIVNSKLSCQPGFIFKKKNYSKNDGELQSLFMATAKIDSLVHSKNIKLIVENNNKFGKLDLYAQNGKNIKLVSDIYVRDLNLPATEHEIFFIDDCNIIAKMTKYSFRSRRIKSIYYFVYHENNYVGCITTVKRSLFHKKEKWMNITNEIIAKNWSHRIYHNIIKSYIF